MPIEPRTTESTFEYNGRVAGITAAGQLVLNANANRGELSVENVGTVALQVFYTVDGSGNPVEELKGGTAPDDGTGGQWQDRNWQGPLWVKAPAGGGVALVSAY